MSVLHPVASPSLGIAPPAPASALRAARATAASPHALTNLVRLVRGLEARAPGGPDDSPMVLMGEGGEGERALQREWANVLYARAMLDELRAQNESSSSTSSTLSQLDATLDDLVERYRARLTPLPLSRVTSNAVPSALSIPTHTASKTSQDHLSHSSPASTRAAAPPAPSNAEVAAASLSTTSTTSLRRRRPGPSLESYLSTRQAQDREGGETGLLSLPRAQRANGSGGATEMSPKDAEKAAERKREELLGRQSAGAMGGAQLHEELGGQLAQMSQQLKRNALHFANSLEDEKGLLESSQAVLEGNLAATRSSKTQLATVSRKGRGTTCMTIGIVILVMVLFVWTYMLIRFT